MGAAAIPLIMSVAAAGVSEANNRKTLRKQDRETARGIQEQAKIQREANARLNQTLDKTESSSAEPLREQGMSRMNKTIASKRQKALESLNQEGDISDAAKKLQSESGANATDYAGNLAGLFSIIDAAGEQRLGEGNMRGDLGMDFSRLGGDASQAGFLARLRAQQHRDNPWLSIAAAGLGGAAQGMASGGFGGGGGGGGGAGAASYGPVSAHGANVVGNNFGGRTSGWLGSGWRGP